MRKKLSQLNIHVPWLQGNPPRTTSVVGLGLVLSINVAKMEWETRDVRSSWDIYIYTHISSQSIRSNAYFIYFHHRILAIFIAPTYLNHLESTPVTMQMMSWTIQKMDCNTLIVFIHRLYGKSWWKFERAKLKLRLGDCDDLLLVISTWLTNEPKDFLKLI